MISQKKDLFFSSGILKKLPRKNIWVPLLCRYSVGAEVLVELASLLPFKRRQTSQPSPEIRQARVRKVHIITDRIRRMREGNVFSLSTPVGWGGGYPSQVQTGRGTSARSDGGGYQPPPRVPPSQVRMGGTPVRGCLPGVPPQPGQDGGTPARGHPPRVSPRGQVRMGSTPAGARLPRVLPPQPGQDWGGGTPARGRLQPAGGLSCFSWFHEACNRVPSRSFSHVHRFM